MRWCVRDNRLPFLVCTLANMFKYTQFVCHIPCFAIVNTIIRMSLIAWRFYDIPCNLLDLSSTPVLCLVYSACNAFSPFRFFPVHLPICMFNILFTCMHFRIKHWLIWVVRAKNTQTHNRNTTQSESERFMMKHGRDIHTHTHISTTENDTTTKLEREHEEIWRSQTNIFERMKMLCNNNLKDY